MESVQADSDMMLPFFFDLQDSALIFVDSAASLDRLASILADCVVLGIDTETKPNFQKRVHKHMGGRNPTALMQLAVRSSAGIETVLLADLLALGKLGLMDRFDEAMRRVLLDSGCIKIGQSLANDFRELCAAYPRVRAFQQVSSIVDTTSLVKVLQPELKQQLSLKNIVKQYLHFNLVKKQQLSDWSRRPLTPKQVHYAACDALVLLRLYDAMVCEAEEKAAETGTIFGLQSCMETFCHFGDLASTDGSESCESSQAGGAMSSGSRSSNKRKCANISGRADHCAKRSKEATPAQHQRFKD